MLVADKKNKVTLFGNGLIASGAEYSWEYAPSVSNIVKVREF